MNKNYIIMACAALAVNGCASKYSANAPVASDIEYGSADTYKNTIEMAGRVYNLHEAPAKIADNDNNYKNYNFAPAGYANNITKLPTPMVVAQNAYQPLYYYEGSGVINNNAMVSASVKAAPAKPAEVYDSSQNWNWY